MRHVTCLIAISLFLCGSSVLAEEAQQGTEMIVSFLYIYCFHITHHCKYDAAMPSSPPPPAMASTVAVAVVRQGQLCNGGYSVAWLEIHIQHLLSCDLAV
jgi:hypothetical protein